MKKLRCCIKKIFGSLHGYDGNWLRWTKNGGEADADKTYTIGINQFADHGSLDNCREGFIEGLRQAGFEEGKNVEFDFSNANSDPGIANQIAQSQVSNGVDLICAIATPSAQYNVAEPKGIPLFIPLFLIR